MSSPIRRIIIVDDHDAIRRGVRQLLETKAYYQVVGEAEDGRTGLELARETRPDIAILDYSIPQLNGLDLSHALVPQRDDQIVAGDRTHSLPEPSRLAQRIRHQGQL